MFERLKKVFHYESKAQALFKIECELHKRLDEESERMQKVVMYHEDRADKYFNETVDIKKRLRKLEDATIALAALLPPPCGAGLTHAQDPSGHE